MALELVKNGTSDEYSFGGTGLDPVTWASVTLDDTGTPATIDSTVLTTQLRATTYEYTGIAITPATEYTGIAVKLSLDNTNWFDALTSGAGGLDLGQIPDQDATGGTVTQTVYTKLTVTNDGTVDSTAVHGAYDAATLDLDYTENQ
jgi:hypothetical protein